MGVAVIAAVVVVKVGKDVIFAAVLVTFVAVVIVAVAVVVVFVVGDGCGEC